MVRLGLLAGVGAVALYMYSREDAVGRVLTQFERNDVNYSPLPFKVDRSATVKQLQDVFFAS